MNTTINEIVKHLNDSIGNVTINGRIRKPVIRPFGLEYFFEIFETETAVPFQTQLDNFQRQEAGNGDKFIHCYIDTVDEAIDLYRQFCDLKNTQSNPDTEQYLRSQVSQRAEHLCLLIIERIIEIG